LSEANAFSDQKLAVKGIAAYLLTMIIYLGVDV
jgi:hypothetical protein